MTNENDETTEADESVLNDESVEEQDVEPERVVDPPEATPEDTNDVERSSDPSWVRVEKTATVTLPSGASYTLQAGQTLQLQPEDVDYIVGEGYGSRMDDPNEG